MKIQIKKAGTLALVTAMALSAALCVDAANFNGKKYYVNPGHGGHDSDDRPTPLPLNVEIFYESDGNLARGLFLRDMLEANGASVKMSRTTNFTSDDLALATIAAQSNSYGGYFMSLHTNGANASANYIVSFYRTSSGAPSTESIAGSQKMGLAASQWHDNNHLTNMTYSTPRSLGCYAFYGYNLGVLGPNNRPGYLVETVFHDYRPDGLRLKSDVYNKYTAWQLLMATRENSGGATGMTDNVKGCIVGDIRNLSKSCGYTNYTTRGRDSYLAVNGATVVLRNASGQQVATMTTDNCANGLYGFFNLDAGTYTLEFSKDGYKSQFKTVTVKDNASTKLLIDFEEGINDGIQVTPGSYTFDKVVFTDQPLTEANAPAKTFSVFSSNMTQGPAVTSSDPDVFPVDKSWVYGNRTDEFTVRFVPKAPGKYSATITVERDGYKQVVSVSGVASNQQLEMETGYTFGEIAGKNPNWLPSGGWGLLRNMCYGDGKLYLVNASEGIIYVVEAQTGKLIRTLDMTGVTDGTFNVMDVKYVDGKVVACNLTTAVAMSTKIYVWDNDDAKPRCILNTTEHQNVARIGDTFDIDGNLTDGRFLFAHSEGVLVYAIKDGVVSGTPTEHAVKNDAGETFNLGTSPRAVADADNKFWVMGQNLQPTLINASGKAEYSMSLASIGNVVQGNDFKRFTYQGTPYALATTYAPTSEAAGQTLTRGGTVLVDCTNGWGDGELLQKYPSAGLGTTRNTYFSTSVDYNVTNDAGVEFWVLVTSQGLGYFRYGLVPDYTNSDAQLLSNLKPVDFGTLMTGQTASYTFTVSGYKLTGDISVSVSGEGFLVEPEIISQADGKGQFSVTFAPEKAGFYNGVITVSTPGAEPLTATLTGAAADEKKYTEKAHFAYDLNSQRTTQDANVFEISYKSTGDAMYAVLVIRKSGEDEVVYEENMGAVKEGKNSYLFDARNLGYSLTHYNWSVKLINYEIEKDAATTPVNVGGARAAVTCFTDPNYPNTFGYTVVGRATNTGIDIYNPAGELVVSKKHANHAVFGGAGATNPMDATTRGNEVVFASWNDKAYGVVAYDITTPDVAPYSVFVGTKDGTGLIQNGSTKVGSGTPTVGIWGTGKNTSLIVFDEDIFGNALAKNVIGTGKTTANALEKIGTGYSAKFANTNVNVKAVENGFFATQIRGNGMDPDVYSLAYITMPAGDLTWKLIDQTDDATILPSSSGGVDVNRTGDLLALSTYEDIRVFRLSWKNDKPVLEPYKIVKNPFGRTTKQTLVKFDAANNIHALNVDNGYFKVYLSHPGQTVETPAPTSFEISTGIENVTADENSFEAVYYNMNGVCVGNGENLLPGLYIKVEGTKATKVIVR